MFGSFILLWAISMAMRDSSLVDIWFAPCIGAAAVLGVFVANGAEPRRVLIAVLAVIWSARLGGYLAWRNWGREDPRYARLRKHVEDQGGNFAWHSLTRINLYQGAIVFVAIAPFLVAQTAPDARGARPARVARHGAGADRRRVRGHRRLAARPLQGGASNAGKVLDTGLWRYSRHPNYFGETCVWWGYWLIACEHPWGWFTVFSPALMTWSILGMMGKELVERRMLKKRPGYEDYVRRTSGFFPWPPRR